jgi:hypothetical protein
MSGTLPEKSAGHQDPAGAAGDDAQRLRAEIQQTRAHLGSTVEQLAAKVDVKSRARAEAGQLTGRIRRAGAQARQAASGYARRPITQGPRTGRDLRVPLALAAGILVAVSLVIWQRKKR